MLTADRQAGAIARADLLPVVGTALVYSAAGYLVGDGDAGTVGGRTAGRTPATRTLHGNLDRHPVADIQEVMEIAGHRWTVAAVDLGFAAAP